MRIVAVMSGKGGVGKTTTCLAVALAAREMGFHTAILDLDLENPSICGEDGATGLVRADLEFPGELIQPPRWCDIPVMSLSLLPLEDFTDTPTMIDEEQKHFLIRQLFKEVDWGDAELLVVDMPPGSGEEVRGLMQLELDGAVVVTSPQRISEAAVRKVMVMAEEYRIPIFGIVENEVNGIDGMAGERLSERFGPPLLCKVEWSEAILRAMEAHEPFDVTPWAPVAQVLADKLLQRPEPLEPEELQAVDRKPLEPKGTAPDLTKEPWRAFQDLTDDMWTVLSELMPPQYRAGKARLDDRSMLNGMLWAYTTRQGWNQMPLRYGKWATARKRMVRWKAAGFWEPIWEKCKEFGYAMTEEQFDESNKADDAAGVLRVGDAAGEQAWVGDEGGSEVPGSEPAERPAEGAEALAGDS